MGFGVGAGFDYLALWPLAIVMVEPMESLIQALGALPAEQSRLEIDSLSQQLAAILESLEQMQQKEKPYLLALYQTKLGELEYRLLTLQIACRALQQRIELAMTKLNRGEPMTQQHLDEFEAQTQQTLLAWQAQLKQQAEALASGLAYMQGLTAVDGNSVQRAKHAYRRLARLLHPDVNPQHQALFEHYWPSVQEAYRQIDADLLEALLQIVETAAAQSKQSKEMPEETIARLKMLIKQQSERLVTLRNQPPFCWAEQLQDEHWLAERHITLETAITLESQRWSQLISRHADIAARVQAEV